MGVFSEPWNIASKFHNQKLQQAIPTKDEHWEQGIPMNTLREA
ncbi:hypothetical protein NC653_015520 [Populus alba x Populus x berolinensis]|uniref:Uncharacterized protein n=1 Tax=Populus alba x Populus x berolinensis TaxID=444605 RepID=A0AAD6QKR6_9ROSI|nr:hypothetical protein NC653_015520 [Populus alba x Populus x berolinensis]